MCPESIPDIAATTASSKATNSEVESATNRRSQWVKAAASTRKQRDQLFDEAAAGMTPERAPAKRVDPLEVWWPQIHRKLKQGFSVRQVHDMTCSPKINLGLGFRKFNRRVKERLSARAATARADEKLTR